LADYSKISSAVSKPILANITEFGKTPLFTRDELAANGVGMILYPLSAFRAMNKAAENVYAAIRRDGTQAAVIDTMQTREELYQAINYYEYEKALDQTLGKDNGYRIIPTPLAASSSRVNKGVFPNSVIFARIGVETADEIFA